MNRWSPRLARETLLGAAVISAALGVGCRPESKVKPGAPVLTTMSIVEADGTKTDITGETADCPSSTAEGDDCDPAGPVCRLAMTYCHCVAKAAGDCSIEKDVPATQGSWVCSYGPQVTVVATFDRLLDGNQLGDGPPAPGIADMNAIPTPTVALTTLTGYTPNGSMTGFIFPGFAGIVGPTLAVNGDPAVPTNSTVSVALNRSRVLAKDGKTSFTATGFIQDGMIAFKTNPFAASITVPVAPPPPPPDAAADDGGADGGGPADAGATDDGGTTADGGASEAGADAAPVCVPPPDAPPPEPVPPGGMEPVTIAFNSPVEEGLVGAHVTVKTNNVVLPTTDYTVMANETGGFDVVPVKPWPASATIEVTVDATMTDVFATQLGAAASASFTTAAK